MYFFRVLFTLLLSVSLVVSEELPTFKVASYNVENWGVTDRFINGEKVSAAMKPDDEKKAVVSILKKINPDILAVQEIIQAPGDSNLLSLQQSLKAGGLDYPHLFAIKGHDDRIQNALFSRFPMVKKRELNKDEFKVTVRTGSKGNIKSTVVRRFVERGFVNAVIQVNPNYQIEVFVAHLKSQRNIPELDNAETLEPGQAMIRRNEALILRGHMMERYKTNPEVNLLAMGDFNDKPNSKTFQTLSGTKADSVRTYGLWLKDWLGDFWTHFYFPEKSYTPLDHLFVTQGLFHEYKEEASGIYRERAGDPDALKWDVASDHRPVFATFYATNLAERIVTKAP